MSERDPRVVVYERIRYRIPENVSLDSTEPIIIRCYEVKLRGLRCKERSTNLQIQRGSPVPFSCSTINTVKKPSHKPLNYMLVVRFGSKNYFETNRTVYPISNLGY